MNARDNFKWTPLHFACHAGILDVVELLLNNGADLEARTLNEATPLMRAIESARPEVVQYLVDRGAQVRTENKKGLLFLVSMIVLHVHVRHVLCFQSKRPSISRWLGPISESMTSSRRKLTVCRHPRRRRGVRAARRAVKERNRHQAPTR